MKPARTAGLLPTMYAVPETTNWYACGTMENDKKDRGGKCYRNEIAVLRSQNRDLQQAYDHVLECEQNRCREVVELQDRLKEVTSERDELSTRLHDELVLGSRLKCDFVLLKNERDELQERISAGWVAWVSNDGWNKVLVGPNPPFPSAYYNRVRLVPDPETPDA